MYKLTDNESIVRLSDNAVIPNDPENRDYAQYIEWLNSGGIPDPEFTDLELLEVLKTSVITKTQARLDDFAQTRNYDGILSAASYATSTNIEFSKEGQYCVEARDLTWAKLYEIMNDVETGARSVPSSFEDIEPELPVLIWVA